MLNGAIYPVTMRILKHGLLKEELKGCHFGLIVATLFIGDGRMAVNVIFILALSEVGFKSPFWKHENVVI